MFEIDLVRKMEDVFFAKREQKLAEARKQLERMQKTKENLAKVSGITNEAVLQKLFELDIRPETLTTLLVIPLIEVAWADGELQDNERQAILDSVKKAGMRNKQIDSAFLHVWLQQKPDPELFTAWEHYIQALSQQLNAEERQSLKEDVMADARAIAESAGGFLGFRTISDSEKEMLAKLEAAFSAG